MDEQRAEFEAWAKSAGWPHSWGYSNTDESGFDSASWDVWQAATQRQQERIAALEAELRHLKSGMAAIRTLLQRDPCAHANTAIQMIDAAIARATHKEQT